jgi:hypothetical protein
MYTSREIMHRAKISIKTKRKAGIAKRISYNCKFLFYGSVIGAINAKPVMIVVTSSVPEKNEIKLESLRLISTFS